MKKCYKCGGKVRKMSMGGLPIDQLSQTANQYGSMLAGIGSSLTPDEERNNPLLAGANVGLKNLGMGPLSMLYAVGGFFGQKKANEREAEQRRLYEGQMREQTDPTRSSYNPYSYMFPDGGKVNSETVELEKGEVFQTPDGELHKIGDNAPSHASGGVIIDLPIGTKVLGKLNAEQDKTYKQLGSKLKRAQDRVEKEIRENPTSIAANTAKRAMVNIDREFNKLFEEQENEKQSDDYMNEKQYKSGGWIKKAVNPAHKGYCTPMTKSTCTPRRKALAKTFKKHHGFHKHPEGGTINNNPDYINSWENIGGSQALLTKGLADKYPNIPIGDIMKSFSTREDFSNANLDFYADSLRNKYGDVYLNPQEINKIDPNYYKYLSTLRQNDLVSTEGDINADTRFEPYFGYRSMLERRYKQGEAPYKYTEQFATGGLTKSYIEKARKKPGGSNVGKYNMNQTFAGPSGGAPRGSFPIGDLHHAKSALKLAHNAPKPSGIKSAVYRKFPQLKKGADGMKIGDSQWQNTDPQYTYGDTFDYQPIYTNQATSPSQLIPYANEIVNKPTKGNNNFDWQGALTTAATLAPVAYNLIQGLKPASKLDYRNYTNPYNDEIRSTLRNRKFNINPILEGNKLAQSTYNYNLRNIAPSKGRYMSNLLAGSTARQRADAEVYAQASNINNQYLAEQAQMDAGLGQALADRRLQVSDINLRNEAARRAYLANAFSGVSQYAQNRELMKNMQQRDVERLALLPSLIPSYRYNQGLDYSFNQ